MKFIEENSLLSFTADVIKAYLCHVDCYEILEDLRGKIPVSSLTYGLENRTEHLRKLLEDRSESQYFRQELLGNINAFFSSFPTQNATIFDVMHDFADKMIVKCENKLCYRYEYTDIWHRFTRAVDEEILLVAAASSDSNARFGDCPCFDFSYCINCDSMEIKKMLCRDNGTSENHFHLKGSSPYFYVSWIYLMNHVDNLIPQNSNR